jgi:hypothetical protein
MNALHACPMNSLRHALGTQGFTSLPFLYHTRSPLVFDLSLAVDPGSLAGLASGQGWRILQVYGSPNGNDTALTGNGTITQVSHL